MLPLKRKRCFYSVWFLLLTVIFLFAGCVTISTGWWLGKASVELAHQMLPASVGSGAEYLEKTTQITPIVRDYVQKRRFPDYIYVVTQRKIYLIYIKDDLFVTFNRTRVSPKSIKITEENIPEPMLALVSIPDQQRLLSARGQRYPKLSEGTVTPTEQTTTMLKRNIGTGFAVSPNGLILTAYHVAEGANSIKVHLLGRGVFEARIEKSSPSTDLLLLRIDAQISTYLIPFLHILYP